MESDSSSSCDAGIIEEVHANKSMVKRILIVDDEPYNILAM